MSYDPIKYLKKFSELKRDIKTKNRFFLKSPILNDIKKYSSISTLILNKNEILWRSRKFKANDSRKLLEPTLPESIRTKVIDDFCSDFKGPFWGYNEKDSFTPPNSSAFDARANPKYISYLYTARDIETAISEIRPRVNTLVNIAEIVVLEDMKLYDFAFWGCSSDPKFDNLYSSISHEFSTPVDGELEDYILTQYISEYIKSIGFDGIQYFSSTRGYKPNTYCGIGKCVTVFNPEKCKVTGSKIYRVNKVEIFADCVLPTV